MREESTADDAQEASSDEEFGQEFLAMPGLDADKADLPSLYSSAANFAPPFDAQM
jgi:hypothetical protein